MERFVAPIPRDAEPTTPEQLGDKELDRAIAAVQQEYAALNSYYKTLQDERFHRWYMRNVIIVED